MSAATAGSWKPKSYESMAVLLKKRFVWFGEMVVAELMQQRKWKNYCSRSLGGVDGAQMAATGAVLGASSSSAYH